MIIAGVAAAAYVYKNPPKPADLAKAWNKCKTAKEAASERLGLRPASSSLTIADAREAELRRVLQGFPLALALVV